MTRLFRKLKIYQKMMIGYLIACLIPTLVAIGVIYSNAAAGMDASALEMMTAMHSQAAANADEVLNSIRSTTVSVLIDSDVLSNLNNRRVGITEQVNDLSYMRRVLFRLTTIEPRIISVGIAMNNGTTIQVGRDGEKLDMPLLLGTDWMREAAEGEELSLIPMHGMYYSDRNRSTRVITVVQPLSSFSGQRLGILILDLEADSILNLGRDFLSTEETRSIRICIEDARHRLYYDSAEAAGDDTDAPFSYYTEPGSDFKTLSCPVGNHGLTLHTSCLRSSLQLETVGFSRIAVLCAFLCVLIIILITVLVSRSITRPVVRLEAAMKQVERGSYRQISVPGGNDEMDGLIRSYNHMISEMENMIRQVYLAGIRQREARLMALQAQINPHMLFNTLESIRMKALLSGNREVAEMTKLLARMFRNALDASAGAPHRIRDELSYVQTYIRLQNLRRPDSCELITGVEEKLMDLRCMVIIFQPLVENSIEHGTAEDRPVMRIRISGALSEDGRKSVFRIQDNGTGFDPEKLMAISDRLERIGTQDTAVPEVSGTDIHIGLENIAQRIRLQYGNECGLKIISSNGEGTCIEVTILADEDDGGEEEGPDEGTHPDC